MYSLKIIMHLVRTMEVHLAIKDLQQELIHKIWFLPLPWVLLEETTEKQEGAISLRHQEQAFSLLVQLCEVLHQEVPRFLV